MTRLLVFGLTLAIALTWSAPASAGGPRVGGRTGSVWEQFHQRAITHDHFSGSQPSAPCRDHGGRWTCIEPREHRHRHRTEVIIVPQPIYVVPGGNSCFVPGYWTYQWVPQTTWQTVYVPGYWSAEGMWVDSQYAQQPVATGFYQPVWIPDRWGC